MLVLQLICYDKSSKLQGTITVTDIHHAGLCCSGQKLDRGDILSRDSYLRCYHPNGKQLIEQCKVVTLVVLDVPKSRRVIILEI